MIAFFFRKIFDEGLHAGNVDHLILWSGMIFFLAVLILAFGLWTRHLILKTTKIVVLRIREKLMQTLFDLPMGAYHLLDRAKTHANIVQNTERIDIMSNALAAEFFPSAILSLGLALFLLFTHWVLFFALVATMSLLILATRPISKKVSGATRRYQTAFDAFSRTVLFSLQKMETIHLYSAEKEEAEKQNQVFDRLRTVSSQMAWLNTFYIQLKNCLFGLSGLVVLILGGALVIKQKMTIGDLLSFFLAIGLLRITLNTLFSSLPHIRAGQESLKEAIGLLQIKKEKPYQGVRQLPFHGRISLQGVGFQYGDTNLLKEVDLSLEPASATAIMGANGAGKSTIIQLLLGFYAPEKGAILADGVPYSELDIDHLRRSFAVVPQHPVLLNRTVYENIAYGVEGASPEDVVQAAKWAMAHPFIDKMAEGYETLVGEGGVQLSGGELQKIAIARALLRRTPFLILDEPSNHLDQVSVRALFDQLKNIPDKPTLLVITHDKKMVSEVDRVYHLSEGRLHLFQENTRNYATESAHV